MVHVAPLCGSPVTSPKLRKKMPKGAAKLDWKSWQSKDEFLLSEVSTRGPSHAASRERWRGAEKRGAGVSCNADRSGQGE